MKTLLILAALLPPIALADVVIEMQSTYSVACKQPEPKPIKLADGKYEMPMQTQFTLAVCQQTGNWRERWTDYPENGGKFIRREPSEQAK